MHSFNELSDMSYAFSVPKDGDTYVSTIHDRVLALIHANIWAGIEPDTLRRWLGNFSTPEEHYFGACMLDAIIYRSQAQVESMMQQLFDRTLPELLAGTTSPSRSAGYWLEGLRQNKNNDPGIRVVPVLREEDPPSKSGLSLCRHYRRNLEINDKWMIWPWQLESAVRRGIRRFLFIDDFVGTGVQFMKFARAHELKRHLEGTLSVYAPLMAHAKGLLHLERRAEWIALCPVEQVGDEHSLFAPGAPWFEDGVNSPDDAMAFYRNLLISRSLSIHPKSAAGYGGLGLTLGFFNATPNNSLPLLWWQSANWHPLFVR